MLGSSVVHIRRAYAIRGRAAKNEACTLSSQELMSEVLGPACVQWLCCGSNMNAKDPLFSWAVRDNDENI